ncbi:MAG: hypothetical protein KF785_04145 [Gemmatimonadales bacterium]|nr:hypothetical protein [Gemmatimonadales bacterium]
MTNPTAGKSSSETEDQGYVTGIADGNLATPVRLRDYLTGVGVVFRLPKRNRKKEKAAAKAEAEREARRFVLPVGLIVRVLAAVAIGAVALTGYRQFVRSIPLPAEIAGTWSTSDGRYAGRSFWLNQTSVAFQNGTANTQFSVHPITRIQRSEVADTLFLTIDYKQEGQSVAMSVAYLAQPTPQIRLVNQPGVRWHRSGNAPAISQ